MPEIPINSWWHDEALYPPGEDAGYEDMLDIMPMPITPQKIIEEEKTPEQLRAETFDDAAHPHGYDNFAGDAGGQYSLSLDNVCQFGELRRPDGSLTGRRVHTSVGQNCPHGMLETLRMYRGIDGDGEE